MKNNPQPDYGRFALLGTAKLLILLVLCAPTILLAQSTVYVDWKYSGPYYDGSSLRPYTNINKAYIRVSNGGTLRINSGPYQVEMPYMDKPLRLEGASAEDRVRIFGETVREPEEPADPSATQMYLPGGLTVALEPPEVIGEGARWLIHDLGRPERPSGYMEEDLFPGHYRIEFKEVAGWKTPAPMDVLIVGGHRHNITARYERLPGFYFKAVPFHEISHGHTLEFFLHSDDPSDPLNPGPDAVLQVSADPVPTGSLSFDVASGLFRYTPAEDDRLPITLILEAGGQRATTIISPRPKLAAEESVVAYHRSLPDEESRDYIQISEATNPEEIFNSSEEPIKTVSVTVSGKTLVFEQEHPAGLWLAYHGRDNIKQMNLYAERVIIRSPLELPQTHVSIHARELKFENDGSIDTTPKVKAIKPESAVYGDGLRQGRAGETGWTAGGIDVFVERFHAEGNEPRFVMIGGKGGAAGEGRDGQEDEDIKCVKWDEEGDCVETVYPFNTTAWWDLFTRRGVPICEESYGDAVLVRGVTNTTWAVKVCDGVPRGEPAVPSGKPGIGGKGGTLRSPLNLAWFANFSGGPAGDRGQDYDGGTLYGPFVKEQVITSGGKAYVTLVKVPCERGSSATALVADRVKGLSGGYVADSSSNSWLHSYALRSIVQYAKDAYLMGQKEESRALLVEYRDLIRRLHPDVLEFDGQDDEALAEEVNIAQLLLEMENLIHRIDSNLDYFGNPEGWVPMLSYEANLQAFRNEVEQSIPILYLTYWIGRAATNLQVSINAAVSARETLNEEFLKMESELEAAHLAIPELKAEAESLQLRIARTEDGLGLLQQALEDRARKNLIDQQKLPDWKRAIGTLAVASRLVPVGQPYVKAIGSGIELIPQFETDKPLESVAKLTPQVFEAVSQADIASCLPKDGKDLAKSKELAKCGKFLGDQVKRLKELFGEVQIDETKLKAELERIKARHSVFAAITEEIKELNKQKKALGAKLASTLQAVSRLTSAITQNTVARHELERNLGQDIALLNHNAVLHLQEIQQRTRDRLLKYQYYLVKAYQYRTLQPYSGSMQLNILFNRFRDIAENDAGHALSLTDFETLKALYIDEIRSIIDETFRLANANAPALPDESSFELNSEELFQLNQSDKLVIDLRERLKFGDGQENIRIRSIESTRLQIRPVGGEIGTLAKLGIKFQHEGISRLTSKGQTYLFRHYQTDEVNPIFWYTSYDGLDGQFVNHEPSLAQESLLVSLLGPEATLDRIRFYSRPAAFAKIEITKDVKTDNDIDLQIDQLRVRVVYEFESVVNPPPDLHVRVSGDLQPVILVSQPDLNGRRDGLGDFHRVYSKFSAVTLEAPQFHGEWTFDRWVVGGAEQPAGLATVTLFMAENDIHVEARYQNDGLPVSGPMVSTHPEDAWLTAGSTAVFAASAGGDEPLTYQWHKDGQPLLDSTRIQGVQTPRLILSDLRATDSGRYSMVVSNGAGMVVSREATLTVTETTLSPVLTEPGTVGFEFDSVPGLIYSIERKLQLTDLEWTVVEERMGTGSRMKFTQPIGLHAAAFYRLRIDAAPELR